MINNPLVSIICITYNHENYIGQCLDGFLMQQTDFIFEILIHDDASTDKTADIIREYEHKYPQIIKPIYQKENQYSKGKDIFTEFQCPRARGKYIALCEGDDYWIDPLKLQKQVSFLESHPDYALVYTSSKVYNQNQGKIKENYLLGEEYKNLEELLTTNRIPTLTTCIRTDAMMSYIKDIEPQKRGWLMGDYPMWIWLSHHYKTMFLPEATTVYRVLEGSASHPRSLQGQEKFTLSVIDITTFFINRFGISPGKKYFEATNAFYYELYDSYLRTGCYAKAKHYAKMIDLQLIPIRKRNKVKHFYLRIIKFKLKKMMHSK